MKSRLGIPAKSRPSQVRSELNSVLMFCKITFFITFSGWFGKPMLKKQWKLPKTKIMQLTLIYLVMNEIYKLETFLRSRRLLFMFWFWAQFYIQLVFKAPLCITLTISDQKIVSGSLFKNHNFFSKYQKKNILFSVYFLLFPYPKIFWLFFSSH